MGRLLWPSSVLSIYVYVTLFQWIACAAQNNVFTSNSQSNDTSGSPTWLLGEAVSVTWTQSFSNGSLGFSPSDGDTFISFYQTTKPGSYNYTWVVDVNGTDWSESNIIYYMGVSDNDASPTDQGFWSLPLYVIAAPSDTVTSTSTITSVPSNTGKPTAAPQVTTVIKTVAVGSVTPNPNPTNTGVPPPPAASTGLSGGATAGIVIGAVVGVAAVAAAIFFFLRTRKLKRNERDRLAATRPSYVPYDQLPPGGVGSPSVKSPGMLSPDMAGGAEYQNEKDRPVSELPARSNTSRISELPARSPEMSPQVPQDPVEIAGTELRRPEETAFLSDEERADA